MNRPGSGELPSGPRPCGGATTDGVERFGQRVRNSFGRHAADYDTEARLQQAMAWRLGQLGASLPLPAGPCADLGAGTGLLSRALQQLHPELGARPPLQLDLCPELLACNPLGRSMVWDLNDGLPDVLQQAALLASSFALQWLEQPQTVLQHWCRSLTPGGWLLLAVPTSGSFPQWRQAAERAAVPCTALGLPDADALLAAAAAGGLQLRQGRRLRFSRPRQGGLGTLRHLQRLGAGASRRDPLNAGQLRRLLRQWPAATPLTWEVLLLIGQRPQ